MAVKNLRINIKQMLYTFKKIYNDALEQFHCVHTHTTQNWLPYPA